MTNIAIIQAPYYQDITNALYKGAVRAIDNLQLNCKSKIKYRKLTVKGALELPIALKYAILTQDFDAAVMIGCVIKGQTDHYQIIIEQVNRKIIDIHIQYQFPIGNAILTVNNIEQARKRAQENGNNKGAEAVEACFSVMELKKQLEPNSVSYKI